MIDGHTHLEYGPLTVDYVLEFVKQAQVMGISELHILDHTHRFKEFEPMYEDLKFIPEQKEWLENKEKKFTNSLTEFIGLKNKVQQLSLPVTVKFGLEVCYTSRTEEFIREVLKPYHFDFLVGSVHSVNGRLYDMKFSDKILWSVYDTDDIYRDYYEEVIKCVESGIFTQLGHPDTIKMFDYYPAYDLSNTYQKLTEALKINQVKAECNTGCHYRYNHKDIGLSDDLLKIYLNNGVEIITASDAHHPEHVGMFIKEANERINKYVRQDL